MNLSWRLRLRSHRQADDARRRWIVAGAAKVRWDEPPADFGTAVAAYERVAAKSGRGLGLVFGGLFFLVAALFGAFGLFTGVRTGWALSAGVVTVLVASMLWRALRAAMQVSRDLSEGERDARARPWGLEAFVPGYARSRGLTVEDPVLVQRRFDSPVLGHAVAALHGPDGHTAAVARRRRPARDRAHHRRRRARDGRGVVRGRPRSLSRVAPAFA